MQATDKTTTKKLTTNKTKNFLLPGRVRGGWGVARASKDANPLKHPAMIALNCPRNWGRVEEKTKTMPKEKEKKYARTT